MESGNGPQRGKSFQASFSGGLSLSSRLPLLCSLSRDYKYTRFPHVDLDICIGVGRMRKGLMELGRLQVRSSASRILRKQITLQHLSGHP